MAGGTLDIWPLYLYHEAPVTVNFAVTRYTSVTLQTRDDGAIALRSRDQNVEDRFASLAELLAARRYRVDLPAWQLRFFQPQTGLEIETHSEAPAGAGISGSSSLMISLGAALNRLCGTGYSIEKLRETVQNIESQLIRVPTGAQDYYPAMYGGVGAIEMGPAGVKRHEIPLNLDDFNTRIVLAYTGKPRNSGINNWEVMKAHINGDRKVHRNFDQIASIARSMRAALEKAAWNEVGRLVRAEWEHRRKNVPGISTDLIDRLVSVTRKKGALGAKACGAGGGGCVFFLVEPDAKERVSETITKEGGEVLDVRVAPRGVHVKVTE